MESLDSKLDLILESHDALGVKVDSNHKEFQDFRKEVNGRFGEVDYKLELIFGELGLIKNDLKQKVGRDEFVLLEKRVSHLEKMAHK